MQRRLAEALADQITLQLAAYFRKRAAEEATPAATAPRHASDIGPSGRYPDALGTTGERAVAVRIDPRRIDGFLRDPGHLPRGAAAW